MSAMKSSLPPSGASGARSGTRLRADYSYGVASLRTGALDEASVAGPSIDKLTDLAGTLPEIFGTVDGPRLGRLWARLGAEEGRSSFREILIISDEQVHVVEPLDKRPDRALLTVTSMGSSLGLVLSTVHAKVSELEEG